MKSRVFILFLFLTGYLSAQSLKGVIYFDNLKIENTAITNLSNGSKVHSNPDGEFEILAKINDTIYVNSQFYESQIIIVENKHIEKRLDIELQEKINNLDQVVINNQKFNEEEYNQKFKELMVYDSKNNKLAYEQPSNGMTDFVRIFKLVRNLFSRKSNKSIETENYASNDDLNLLFRQGDFFNNKSVIELVSIEDQDLQLFMNFCEGNVDKNLLDENNKFVLMDRLIELSMKFKSERNDFILKD